jgi:hypothetical protein
MVITVQQKEVGSQQGRAEVCCNDKLKDSTGLKSEEASGRSYRRAASLSSLEWNYWNGIKHKENTCLTTFHVFHSSHYNEPVLLQLPPPASWLECIVLLRVLSLQTFNVMCVCKDCSEELITICTYCSMFYVCEL